MAPVGESEAYVPRPGDVIEIDRDAEYWRLGFDDRHPDAWEQTVRFGTGEFSSLQWVNAQGAEPFDRLPTGRQVAMERNVDGQFAEFGLVRDESGQLRVEARRPQPKPLDLTGAEPFKLRAGDQVVTNDDRQFSYGGTDASGSERWHVTVAPGLSADVPDAPFKPGEAATVVRTRGDDERRFTVATGDDGLVLVPGVEQPPVESSAEQGVPAPQTDAGERPYAAHSPATQNRRQSPSAGR